MNALISFRGNSAGSYSPTAAQRRAAQEQITSSSRARWTGVLRQVLAQARANPASATDPTKSAQTATGGSQAVSKSAAATQEQTEAATGVTMPELDRDAFLRLLVLEMQNQDPLEPVDNTDMIAQLAQFSALEQMNNLNASFEGVTESLGQLSGNIDQLNFISAQNLLGRQVQGLSEQGELVEGRVDGIHLDGSIVVLNIGGTLVPMSGVLRIGEAPAAESAAQEKKS